MAMISLIQGLFKLAGRKQSESRVREKCTDGYDEGAAEAIASNQCPTLLYRG
jgi:hypothetical protein